MPLQSPQWNDFLKCSVCLNLFKDESHLPISLACGHTLCQPCLGKFCDKPNQKCPFDQICLQEPGHLPINTALALLGGIAIRPEFIRRAEEIVGEDNWPYFESITKCQEEIALLLKPLAEMTLLNVTPASGASLSRPMQRKLVTLLTCQLIEPEGRLRALRASRSLGERTVIEMILQHQNPQHLASGLWAAVRNRGCQFLGPAMQEEVIRLILSALEDGSALSRKALVLHVVQRLEHKFSQTSKTAVGHVVQLLYRASCFKVTKREDESSLMQLKEDYRSYDALRREHDAQIVQIAQEAGLRIAPEHWSQLLYGDQGRKSHMQSVIDKLQSPQSFVQSINELMLALQRMGDPSNLMRCRASVELLAAIDPTSDQVPDWPRTSEVMSAVRSCLQHLVEFVQHHHHHHQASHTGSGPGAGGRHNSDPMVGGLLLLSGSSHSNLARYKTSLCRDMLQRGVCPRGKACTFAHDEQELERYRQRAHRYMRRHWSFSGSALSEAGPPPPPPPHALMQGQPPSTLPRLSAGAGLAGLLASNDALVMAGLVPRTRSGSESSRLRPRATGLSNSWLNAGPGGMVNLGGDPWSSRSSNGQLDQSSPLVSDNLLAAAGTSVRFLVPATDQQRLMAAGVPCTSRLYSGGGPPPAPAGWQEITSSGGEEPQKYWFDPAHLWRTNVQPAQRTPLWLSTASKADNVLGQQPTPTALSSRTVTINSVRPISSTGPVPLSSPLPQAMGIQQQHGRSGECTSFNEPWSTDVTQPHPLQTAQQLSSSLNRLHFAPTGAGVGVDPNWWQQRERGEAPECDAAIISPLRLDLGGPTARKNSCPVTMRAPGWLHPPAAAPTPAPAHPLAAHTQPDEVAAFWLSGRQNEVVPFTCTAAGSAGRGSRFGPIARGGSGVVGSGSKQQVGWTLEDQLVPGMVPYHLARQMHQTPHDHSFDLLGLGDLHQQDWYHQQQQPQQPLKDSLLSSDYTTDSSVLSMSSNHDSSVLGRCANYPPCHGAGGPETGGQVDSSSCSCCSATSSSDSPPFLFSDARVLGTEVVDTDEGLAELYPAGDFGAGNAGLQPSDLEDQLKALLHEDEADDMKVADHLLFPNCEGGGYPDGSSSLQHHLTVSQ